MLYIQGEKNNCSVLKYMAPCIYESWKTQVRAPSFKGNLNLTYQINSLSHLAYYLFLGSSQYLIFRVMERKNLPALHKQFTYIISYKV